MDEEQEKHFIDAESHDYDALKNQISQRLKLYLFLMRKTRIIS